MGGCLSVVAYACATIVACVLFVAITGISIPAWLFAVIVGAVIVWRFVAWRRASAIARIDAMEDAIIARAKARGATEEELAQEREFNAAFREGLGAPPRDRRRTGRK